MEITIFLFFYFRCQNCAEVLAVIKSIPKLKQAHPKIQLLVIDSISFHFRHDFPDARDRVKLLRIMTKELIHPAVDYKMAVSVPLMCYQETYTSYSKMMLNEKDRDCKELM